MKNIVEFLNSHHFQMFAASLWLGITIAILSHNPRWIGVIVTAAWLIDLYLEKCLITQENLT